MTIREENLTENLAVGPPGVPTPKLEPAKPHKVDVTTGFSKADLYLFLCVSIWGFNVPLIKLVLNYLDPLVISMLRFGVAGLVFLVLAWGRERSLAIQWRHLGLIVACAVSGIALNQIFFVYALSNTTSSEVSLLMASTPTFATLTAALLGFERIKRNFWFSLPVSVSGVALIVLLAPGAHLSGSWLGDVLALCTSASWAVYTVLLRPLMQYYSILKISAYVSLIGVVALLPFGYSQIDLAKFQAMPLSTWLVLLFCTFGAVVFTNILWYTGVKRLGSARTAFYSYFQPFVGVVAASLLLQERLVIWQPVGGVLIIGGLLIYRLSK
jgi:drug/metabolite transporter (DMT)-like permease